MKHFTFLALLFFVAILHSSGCRNSEDTIDQTPPPSPNLPGAPLIPEMSVLRPYFQTTLGNVDVGSAVGTAFAVEHHGSDSPIVLTALSILGPASGLSRQALTAELSDVFERCTFGSAFGDFDGVIPANGFLGIPESAPFEIPSEAGDILAFTLPKKNRVGTFRLSCHRT